MQKYMPGKVEHLQAAGQRVLAAAAESKRRRARLWFDVVEDPALRRYFDLALDRTHYARSCQRVGRCMRLAIIKESVWVGGIVLGSTFPNIGVRDEALGLKQFVRGFSDRGLRNAWCAENTAYWNALQSIVNHARTFIFPQFQGQGIGKTAHRLLPREGVKLWERKYEAVYALDTLCDSSDSGLFVSNGWSLVGETKGYTADYKRQFSRAGNPSLNNAALKKGRVRWQVWVRVVDSSLRPSS